MLSKIVIARVLFSALGLASWLYMLYTDWRIGVTFFVCLWADKVTTALSGKT